MICRYYIHVIRKAILTMTHKWAAVDFQDLSVASEEVKSNERNANYM